MSADKLALYLKLLAKFGCPYLSKAFPVERNFSDVICEEVSILEGIFGDENPSHDISEEVVNIRRHLQCRALYRRLRA